MYEDQSMNNKNFYDIAFISLYIFMGLLILSGIVFIVLILYNTNLSELIINNIKNLFNIIVALPNNLYLKCNIW